VVGIASSTSCDIVHIAKNIKHKRTANDCQRFRQTRRTHHHCWWQVVFLWKRGIGNMFSSCFLRKHQRNCIRAYQKRKARGLFPKETLAKCVSLMLFPWETGLGTSSGIEYPSQQSQRTVDKVEASIHPPIPNSFTLSTYILYHLPYVGESISIRRRQLVDGCLRCQRDSWVWREGS
jgi:hypothetical protein